MIWPTNLRPFLWIYPVFTNFESLWSSLTKHMEVSLTWFRSICLQSKSEFKQITPTLESSWGESRNFDWFPQKVHYWHFLLILSALLFFLLKINVSKMWGEEGLNLTSKTTFCQHLESCSAGQGKVSVDRRSSLPIYEIWNALEYFVFWSNTSEIQSRRRCRVFVSLILLH